MGRQGGFNPSPAAGGAGGHEAVSGGPGGRPGFLPYSPPSKKGPEEKLHVLSTTPCHPLGSMFTTPWKEDSILGILAPNGRSHALVMASWSNLISPGRGRSMAG